MAGIIEHASLGAFRVSAQLANGILERSTIGIDQRLNLEAQSIKGVRDIERVVSRVAKARDKFVVGDSYDEGHAPARLGARDVVRNQQAYQRD